MKKTLYLKVEVDGQPESDPMQDLSDVATWAEVAFNTNAIKCLVTAYAKPQDIVMDEAESESTDHQGMKPAAIDSPRG